MVERSGEFREQSSEEAADIIYRKYLRLSNSRMPTLQQEDWNILIDVNRGDDEALAKAKKERSAIVNTISSLIDRLILEGFVERTTESKRGEIIELAIKKLVKRRRDIGN